MKRPAGPVALWKTKLAALFVVHGSDLPRCTLLAFPAAQRQLTTACVVANEYVDLRLMKRIGLPIQGSGPPHCVEGLCDQRAEASS